jgi:hypothetical protein
VVVSAVVVVAGPKTDFFPPEIDALKKYLEKAGKLLLEIDPPDKADSPQPVNLIALAHEWGIDVGNDIVVDASGMGRLIGTDASVPVVATYGSHPITANFSFVTAFPLARSLTTVMGGVNGHTAQPFAQTSRKAGPKRISKTCWPPAVTLDESKGDKKDRSRLRRPHPPSAASTPPGGSNPLDPEAPKPETRVAVVGDSDFAANAGLGIQGNRDLFMNTIGWLSQQENLIAIRPKNPEDRRITLTATQQSNIMWLSLVIILPAYSAPASTRGPGALNRGLRSTIALLVVLIGLCAYIYFVVSKNPRVAPRRQRACLRLARSRQD